MLCSSWSSLAGGLFVDVKVRDVLVSHSGLLLMPLVGSGSLAGRAAPAAATWAPGCPQQASL